MTTTMLEVGGCGWAGGAQENSLCLALVLDCVSWLHLLVRRRVFSFSHGRFLADGVNAMRDAVAPPQEEEPGHLVPGRGGDGVGAWPIRQNPIPLRSKNQGAWVPKKCLPFSISTSSARYDHVTDGPVSRSHGRRERRQGGVAVAPPQAEQLVLGHGDGGISVLQQPQTRYYLVPVSNFVPLPSPLQQIELFGIFFLACLMIDGNCIYYAGGGLPVPSGLEQAGGCDLRERATATPARGFPGETREPPRGAPAGEAVGSHVAGRCGARPAGAPQ